MNLISIIVMTGSNIAVLRLFFTVFLILKYLFLILFLQEVYVDWYLIVRLIVPKIIIKQQSLKSRK